MAWYVTVAWVPWSTTGSTFTVVIWLLSVKLHDAVASLPALSWASRATVTAPAGRDVAGV